MFKTYLKLIVFILSLSLAEKTLAKDVVVLVPGFFNSFNPEYFSQDIVRSFTQKGFQVYTAQGLNPFGTIEDNGSRLEFIFQQIEKLEDGHVSFNVVAHSAGGFYTLWVANRQKFEVKNILTISTPFKGVEFVDTWLKNSLLFKGLTDLAHLDSIYEMTQAGVANFMASVRVNPYTKLVSFGGYQSSSLNPLDTRELSAPLRITDRYISEVSDGIVGFSSAVSFGHLKTTKDLPAQHLTDSKFIIHLDHWEQVVDYRSFLFLGTLNIDYIRNEQIRFYSGLATYLQTLQ